MNTRCSRRNIRSWNAISSRHNNPVFGRRREQNPPLSEVAEEEQLLCRFLPFCLEATTATEAQEGRGAVSSLAHRWRRLATAVGGQMAAVCKASIYLLNY